MLGSEERPTGTLHDLIDDELHVLRSKHGDDLLQNVVCVPTSNAMPHVGLQRFGYGQTPGVVAIVQGLLQVSARRAVTCHVPGTSEICVRSHCKIRKITQAMLETNLRNEPRKSKARNSRRAAAGVYASTSHDHTQLQTHTAMARTEIINTNVIRIGAWV